VSKQVRFILPALRRVLCEIHGKSRRVALCGLALAALALMPLSGFAQYSANIQGTVQDPSGAGVSGATCT